MRSGKTAILKDSVSDLSRTRVLPPKVKKFQSMSYLVSIWSFEDGPAFYPILWSSDLYYNQDKPQLNNILTLDGLIGME